MNKEVEKIKHFDGSICECKKTIPKHSEIVKYWVNYKTSEIMIIDIGEPSCWACGYYIESYPICENPKMDIEEIYKLWNKHTYLERCHIVAKSLGGCNCAINIVLLCNKCHINAPNTTNREYFIKTITTNKLFKNGNPIIKSFKKMEEDFDIIKNLFNENNIKFESENESQYIIDIIKTKEFKEYFNENTTIHFSESMNITTKVGVLIQFLQSKGE